MSEIFIGEAVLIVILGRVMLELVHGNPGVAHEPFLFKYGDVVYQDGSYLTAIVRHAFLLYHEIMFILNWTTRFYPSHFDFLEERLSACSLLLLGMLCATVLHAWAIATLGRYYTKTIGAVPQQQLIQTGPYAYISHPGYLAEFFTSFFYIILISNSPITIAVVTIYSMSYVQLRANLEEDFLISHFGLDYSDYQITRGRYLPGIRGDFGLWRF